MTEELSGEGCFAHPGELEEFGEADGFSEVGVDETDSFGDGLLVVRGCGEIERA